MRKGVPRPSTVPSPGLGIMTQQPPGNTGVRPLADTPDVTFDGAWAPEWVFAPLRPLASAAPNRQPPVPGRSAVPNPPLPSLYPSALQQPDPTAPPERPSVPHRPDCRRGSATLVGAGAGPRLARNSTIELRAGKCRVRALAHIAVTPLNRSWLAARCRRFGAKHRSVVGGQVMAGGPSVALSGARGGCIPETCPWSSMLLVRPALAGDTDWLGSGEPEFGDRPGLKIGQW